jgi:hypothetical protein
LTGAEYQIDTGLVPGERLIVSGIQKVADGVPVTATAS